MILLYVSNDVELITKLYISLPQDDDVNKGDKAIQYIANYSPRPFLAFPCRA